MPQPVEAERRRIQQRGSEGVSPVQTEVLVTKTLGEGLGRDVAGQTKCRVVVVVVAPEDLVSIAEGVIDPTDKLGLDRVCRWGRRLAH